MQNVFWFTLAPAPPTKYWGLKVTTEYYQLPKGRHHPPQTNDSHDMGH